MKTKTFETIIHIIGQDMPVTVSYIHHKGSPGKYYGPPEACYEGEDPWIEIDKVMTYISMEDVSVLMTDADLDAVSDDILDYLRECEAADKSDEMDYRREDFINSTP